MTGTPREWSRVQLGQAGKWLSGGTPSTSNSAFWNGDIPWISSGSLTSFRISDSDRRVTPLGAQNGTRLVPQGTILMVVRGMSLKTEFRMGITQRTVAFGQDCKALTAAPGIDAEFLAYAVLARSRQILGIVDEAGHGTGRLNTDQLYAVEIGVPPTGEQRAIAGVLRALDDKLAANATLLATAEGLVDALGRLVLSHGETSRRLESLAQVTKGVSYRRSDLADDSDTAMVTLKSITRDGRYATAGLKGFVGQAKATQYLSEGDLVVAQTDLTQAAEVVGRAVRVPESSRHKELVASLDLAIVRPRGHVPSEYLLAILRSDEFRQHCRDRTSGTTVLHLGRGAIESFDAPWVEPDVQLRFSERVKPLHELMETKARESESLVRVRDALLPQLMSGRIRVRDAERVFEGVV